MIGVGQQDGSAHLPQVAGGEGLDRGLGAHRDEGWRGHDAVGRVDEPCPRPAVGIGGDEVKSKVHDAPWAVIIPCLAIRGQLDDLLLRAIANFVNLPQGDAHSLSVMADNPELRGF